MFFKFENIISRVYKENISNLQKRNTYFSEILAVFTINIIKYFELCNVFVIMNQLQETDNATCFKVKIIRQHFEINYTVYKNSSSYLLLFTKSHFLLIKERFERLSAYPDEIR